jgi:hypothetical protein
MNQQPYAPFPDVRIPDGTREQEKLRLCAPVISFVPEALRPKTRRLIRQSSLLSLTKTFNLCRQYQDQLCPHAALAPLLDPSLATMYGAALYKVPEEDHELIVSLLSSGNDTRRQEYVYQFLAHVESDGLERALTTALERTNNGGLPMFGEKPNPGANNNPAATLGSWR